VCLYIRGKENLPCQPLERRTYPAGQWLKKGDEKSPERGTWTDPVPKGSKGKGRLLFLLGRCLFRWEQHSRLNERGSNPQSCGERNPHCSRIILCERGRKTTCQTRSTLVVERRLTILAKEERVWHNFKGSHGIPSQRCSRPADV